MIDEEHCPSCNEALNTGEITSQTVELECGHEKCFLCCTIADPEDNFKTKCNICKNFTNITSKSNQKAIINFIKKNGIKKPCLKCK